MLRNFVLFLKKASEVLGLLSPNSPVPDLLVSFAFSRL